jgi:hypothetical protein
MPSLRTAPFSEYAPLTSGAANVGITYTAADAAGDKWGVTISTQSTLGAQHYMLHYACINVAAISDALASP